MKSNYLSLYFLTIHHYSKEYNTCVDIWAIGITTFWLFTKSYPFESESDKNTLMKTICAGEYIYEKLDKYSEDVKNFIKSCLVIDVTKRASISDLLNHPLLKF